MSEEYSTDLKYLGGIVKLLQEGKYYLLPGGDRGGAYKGTPKDVELIALIALVERLERLVQVLDRR